MPVSVTRVQRSSGAAHTRDRAWHPRPWRTTGACASPSRRAARDKLAGHPNEEGSMATEGMRLEPRDEYPHEPDELSNFNESVYVNGFDPVQRLGGWLRLRNSATRGDSYVLGFPYPPE